MALTLPCDSRGNVSLDDYVEHVRSKVDLRSLDSLADSAVMLRALANDRTLIVRRLNQQVENSFRTAQLPSAQTIFLGGGPNFYVRAAIWPSASAVAGGRVYQEKFAYHQAHDHNFTFLTVNYLGPGYESEIYEYDSETVQGYVGEGVNLRFLEKVRFGQGVVMLYRANRDVHIQYPPEDLTVTLNLMVSLPDARMRDQTYFDTARSIIVDYPIDTDASKRVSLMKLAGHMGNADTAQVLNDIARRHPCRRTRLAAFEALSEQLPDRVAEIWEQAARDPSPFVANAAGSRLAALASEKSPNPQQLSAIL